ncbi:MAG: hypothetical protein ACJ771_14420 [Chloroflexota bacterium]
MTDDRSLERAARSWIEVGPTRAPSRAVEAALLRIETTPQERALRIPWRFTNMPIYARVAGAAVVGVLLVGGAVYLFSPGGRSNVGAPLPSPTTVSTPHPSPSASASEALGAAPPRTLGDWQAMSGAAIPGLFGANERIQLSVDWQDGLHTWIQTADGTLVLKSTSRAASADELRLVSIAGAEAVGCTDGQVGRYRWSRSSDGKFLTLTAIDDACTDRVSAMSRTWVHSLSAVTDGGIGVIPLDPWIVATLPSRQWAMGGANDGPVLRAFGTGAPDVEFTIVRNPMGFDAPCAIAGGRHPVAIEPTAAAIVDHIRGLPGVTVTTADATIGGRPAVHLTVTSDAAIECPAGEIMAFHPPSAAEDGEYTMALGQPRSFWAVELDGDVVVIWFAGDGVTPTDEQAVIDSIGFLDRLPTP